MPCLKNIKFIVLVFSLCLFVSSNAGAQQATLGFTAEYSNIFELLAEKKTANPKIKPEELAAFANDLLTKKGLNYEFEFLPQICNAVAERRKKLKPNEPNKIGGKFNLQPKEGDATNIFIPNIESAPCGKCFLTLPVVAADDKEFIALIQNRNTGFLRTDGFSLNEIALIDAKDLNKIIRRWTIPFAATPLGVSADGLRLFLPLPAKNLDELVLIVFENGVIEFVKRADAEIKDLPTEMKNNAAPFKFLSFGAAENQRILKFKEKCLQ